MERNGKIHEHGMRRIFMISFSLICMNYVYIICVYIYIYNVNEVRCLLSTNWNKTILFFVLVHMDLVQGLSSFQWSLSCST